MAKIRWAICMPSAWRRPLPSFAIGSRRSIWTSAARRRPVDYKSIVKLYIRPQLGKLKVADLRHADVEKLHRDVAKHAPIRANRTVAVLSKMISLAIKWEIRADNPAKGIERSPENRREKFLKPSEIVAIAVALQAHPEKTSANPGSALSENQQRWVRNPDCWPII